MSVQIDTIEHMFEHVSVSSSRHPMVSPGARQVTLERLREKIRGVEKPRVDIPVFPTLPGLDALFPEGGLRTGAVYTLSDHRSLLWALLATPTRHGHWAALVGMSHLGFAAAMDWGVDLERLVLLPQPGDRWWIALAELVDVIPLVVCRPSGSLPSASARERIEARLRERGGTLLLLGPWPSAHGHLVVEAVTWSGLQSGFGLLQTQQLECAYTPSHRAFSTRVTLRLGPEGIQVDYRVPTPVTALSPRVVESLPQAVTPARRAG